MMRLDGALDHARQQGVDRLDAQLLLAHHLRRSRAWLIAHADEAIDAAAEQRYRGDVDRRAAGWPLAYLLGRREFRGLDLCVSPAVLVPRPETEGLVDWALQVIAGLDRPRVIDLGTGSGAIAIALAHERPDAVVTAVDFDLLALEVAAANVRAAGVAVRLVHGHWWAAVPNESFDLAVANPPYIAEGDPHLPALRHEPRHALVSGAEGLDALNAVIDGAPARVAPGGRLLLEHGFDQATRVRRRLEQAGFSDLQTRVDMAGLDRCTGGSMPR